MWWLASGLRVLSSLTIAIGLGLGTYLFALRVPGLTHRMEVTPMGAVIVLAAPLEVACSFAWFHRNFWAGVGAAMFGLLQAGQGMWWLLVGAGGMSREPQGPFDGLGEVILFFIGVLAVGCGGLVVLGGLLSLIAERVLALARETPRTIAQRPQSDLAMAGKAT